MNIQQPTDQTIAKAADAEVSTSEAPESAQNVESILKFTFSNLKDAGLHFGHKTNRVNRNMMTYIFDEKDGIHIINLGKTFQLLKSAVAAIRKCVAKNGRILFVGTQHQSKDAARDAAKQCAQYFIVKKWPGGFLTNWKTMSKSIQHMKDLEKQLDEGYYDNHKKHEQIKIKRAYDKEAELYEGVRDMRGLPDMLVITSYHELTAVKEAQKLGIPIVLLLDTDGNPQGIEYPVPGNDDSILAVDLFCTLCSRAALIGIHDEQEILKQKEEAKKQREENAKEESK